MKFKVTLLLLLIISGISFGQNARTKKKATLKVEKKRNDSIPALIPQKRDGKFGFVDQYGKVMIRPEYINVGFFTEDCNLLNSPNEKLRKFGSNKYASASDKLKDYRIDEKGKKVYQFKEQDLGQCDKTFITQIFQAYINDGLYGLIDRSTFKNSGDNRQFKIYPQYEYLFVLAGKDPKVPMIIAINDDKYGIIDINNNIIIPFEYSDIKRNFSWKLAKLFEVTKDGKNYYFIDDQNHGY